jgi:biotin operon repressor
MPDRQRDIFLRRLGVKNGTPETLKEIGDAYGLSRERVRQLEYLAMSYLRNHCAFIYKNVEFVKKWQMAGSAKMAARAAGATSSHAYYISNKLREGGIPLKTFPRHPGTRLSPLTEAERKAVDPKFKSRVEKRDRFIKLWNSGVRSEDISLEMGWSATAVSNSMAARLRTAGYKMTPRGRAPLRKVSNDDFTRVWQMASSVQEVADKTGMNFYAVVARANSLRSKGVPLNRMNGRDNLTPARIKELKALALKTLASRRS